MPRTLNKTELPLKAIRIIINTNPLYNKHDAVYLIHAYTLVDYIHLVSKVAKSCQVLKVKALLAKLCVTGRNGVILGSIFRQKVRLLSTHCTIQYNMVYRPVYSLYIWSQWYIRIFTLLLCASIYLSPRVVYIGYRPPYCTIYIYIYIYIYIRIYTVPW